MTPTARTRDKDAIHPTLVTQQNGNDLIFFVDSDSFHVETVRAFPIALNIRIRPCQREGMMARAHSRTRRTRRTRFSHLGCEALEQRVMLSSGRTGASAAATRDPAAIDPVVLLAQTAHLKPTIGLLAFRNRHGSLHSEAHSVAFTLVPGGVRTTPDDPRLAATILERLTDPAIPKSLDSPGQASDGLMKLFQRSVVPTNGLLPSSPYFNYLRWRRSIDPERFDEFHPRIGHRLALDGMIPTRPHPNPTPTPTPTPTPGGGGTSGGTGVTAQPPTVVITAPAQGVLTNHDVTIRGQVSAGSSPVATLQARVDSGAPFALTFDPAMGSFSFPTGLPQDGSADKVHTVSVQAVDTQGNTSAAATDSFTLDTQAPTISLPSSAPGGTTASNITIAGTVADNLSGVAALQEQVDSGPLVPVAFDASGHFSVTTQLPLDGTADGAHTVHFQATDKAGNVSAPSNVSFTLATCSFISELTGWTVHQDGGTAGGQGTVTVAGTDAVLDEGDSFDVTLSRPVVLGAGTTSLSFMYAGPSFDTSNNGRMNDAFEAALVNAQGQPLVPTIAGNRDAFFNLTEGQPVALGQGTTVNGQMVTLDLSGVAAGTTGTLIFRLVNNDGDASGSGPDTSVRIACVDAPFGPSPAAAPALGGGSVVAAALAVQPAVAAFDTRTLASPNTATGPVTSPPNASGLAVSVAAPAAGATFTPGQSVLVSGQASAGGTGRVVAVTVNGIEVEALDAAGDYFTTLTIAPGQNPIQVQATDDHGHTATASLTVSGVARPAGAPDLSALADVSASFTAGYARTSLDNGIGVVYADVAVRNVGQYPVGAPLYVGVAHLSDPSVHVRDQAGTTADGIPYYDFTGLINGGALGPGSATGTLSLAFSDPQGVRFTYDLVFFGELNQPPVFTTVPVVTADTGASYHYAAQASDADGDPLTYTLVMGPAGMTVDAATGRVSWSPQAADVGNHNVAIRADDGRGGSAVQQYIVTAAPVPPNLPPVFTSTPVVAAAVGEPYTYQATASDLDGDTLAFSVVTSPVGLAVDPATGLVTWTPSESQLGLAGVTLQVADGRGGTATQTYSINVGQQPGNEPPVITSQPVTSFVLPPPQNAPGGAIFLTGHDPDFHATQGPDPTGAEDITKTAIHFVMDPAYNPFVARGVTKFLFVESKISPPSGHVDGENGIIASGYTAGKDFEVSDASTLNAALDQLGTTYSAIVIGSDFGGILTQAELNILDARSADIIKFLNEGGGLYAMAESDSGAQLTPGGGQFQFLPFVVSSTPANQGEGGDTVTAFGTALGLTNTDVNGNFSHNIFNGSFGLNIVDQDGQGRILSLAGRGQVTGTGVVPVPYTYPVTAVDSDHDPLTFSLPQGPTGMTIDASSGAITWSPTSADVGAHPVTVRVDDGRGGFDTQSYTLNVSQGLPGEIDGSVFDDLNGDGVRNGVSSTPPPVPNAPPSPIKLTQISTTFNNPIDLDYYEPDNSIIATVNYAGGQPRNFEEIKADGSHTPFSAVTGFTDEVYIATARSGNLGGFTAGDLFVGNGQTGQIARITNGGATVISPWVKLPGGQGLIRGGLQFDQTGVFGGDLIVDTDAGQVWRITAAGTPHLVANVNDFLEGVTTIPNDPARYGPLAGTILAPNEHRTGFYAIDVTGKSTFYDVGIPAIEDIHVVPANENFFGVDYGSGRILGAPASQFSNSVGDILLVQEYYGGLYILSWDGTKVVTQPIPLTSDSLHASSWEGSNFVPAGISQVPPVPLEPGLSGWTVYIDQNHDGHLDPGDPSTTTDANGAYAFTGLAPGTYDVAEVPRPGWNQTGPPGGVAHVTVASGQVIRDVNFGNQLQPGSISGTVSQAPAGTGLQGWTVYIDQNGSGQLAPGDPSATTDAQGHYAITGLAPGTYTVAEVPQTGWHQTTAGGIRTPQELFAVSLAGQSGATATTSKLYEIAAYASTPTAVSLVDTGVALVQLAIDPGTNAAYAIGYQIGDSHEELFKVDLATGAVTPIGPTGVDTLTGLAFAPGGVLYAIGSGSNNLETIDTTTGAATVAFSLGSLGGLALAAQDDHTLFVAGAHLLLVDPTTKKVIDVGPIAAGQMTSLAIDASGHLIGGLQPSGTGGPELFAIDPSTATTKLIGTIGGAGSAGLAGLAFSSPDIIADSTRTTFQITIAAGDAVPGVDFGNTQNATGSPFFTTSPPGSASVGQQYLYESVAFDPAGRPLTYDLPVAPAGMVIGPTNGIILWTPDSDEVGVQHVLIRARDDQGGVVLQAFDITVSGPVTPPVITSTPLGPAVAGLPYEYRVQAQDAGGYALSYQLTTSPTGMTIDASTGAVDWTPMTSQVGTAAVAVLVDDGHGGQATQSFNLPVVASTTLTPPTITSKPGATVRLGTIYVYAVQATDANGLPLNIQLTTAPAGMTIDAGGHVTWTPTARQVGPNPVEVKVDDGQGDSVTQDFTVTVTTTAAVAAPVITSSPPLTGVVDRAYVYNATATAAQGGTLVWGLDAAPAGMSIDAMRGTIRWTPAANQVGPQPVTVHVDDAQGGVVTQSFTVTVGAAGLPPVISSTAPTTASVGALYTYPVRASSPDGDALTFSLPTAPAQMAIDPASGLILWAPAAGQTGPQPVTIQVADGQGGVATQSFTVVVSASAAAAPPSITSTPPAPATVGLAYTYNVTATNRSGAALTFSLQAAPTGMTIDPTSGQVSWTPTPDQKGSQTVAVEAADPSGAAAIQQFTLPVLGVPQPPKINSTPVTSVTAGLTYRYDVQASDADSVALTYRLTAAPQGMAIDALGRVTWATTAAAVGSAHVVIEVDDGRGLSATQTFDITVSADTEAPQVQVQLSENPANIGDTVTFMVAATDNVGVASELVTVGGTALALDTNGLARLKLDHAGSFDVVATATDAAGNTGMATASLLVIDPTVTGAPSLTISSLADGTTVTGPTDIKGTVSGGNLASYSIDVLTLDGTPVAHVSGGTSVPATGVLGTLDPSMLANGPYDLRLTATNTGGHTATLEQTVNVAGTLKLGNFTVSLNDLTVPVAGVPITITRTYDTLQSGQSEDFGYGWRLAFADTSLQTSVPKTGDEQDGLFNAFQNGTKVYVTVPGGKRETFTFDPQYAGGLAGSFLGILNPHFDAEAGVTDTLSVDSADLMRLDDGTYTDFGGGLPYNPSDPNFGGRFYLTTKDGIRYTIDGQSGSLVSVTDRNGNQLNFSDSGVSSSSGQSVTFRRDPEGRITAITDPTGKTVTYGYDAAGDLVSVTDRDGHTTTLTYLASPPHYLDQILDPLGRPVARNEYDAQGRLTQIVGPNGTTNKLNFDPSQSMETSYDALGNPTTYEYDDRGNIVTQIDALGGITRRTFDSNNNMLTQTDPLGLTTTYTYDSAGDVLTTTDPLGHTTRSTYDANGHVLTQIDPLGNTVTNTYNAQGNLLTTTDPDGNTTVLTYGSAPGPISVKNAAGNVTQFQYDASGNITRQVDAAGGETQFAYDANGNLVSESHIVTTASGPRTLVTSYTYDGAGNQVSMTDANGATSHDEYDAAGRRTAHVDPLGNRTVYSYDASGNLIEVTYADGTTQHYTYDADGNRTSYTDQAGQTTDYTYDALGRLVDTIEPDSTPNDLTDNPRTQVEYNADGLVTALVDELGNRTEYTYDASGRKTGVRDALGDVTSISYDGVGRPVVVTDALGHQTKTTYDPMGHPIGVLYADGTQTASSYDQFGHLIAQTDQAGHTTSYTYDPLGRLTSVEDALHEKTTYSYDEMGNLVRQEDADGQVTMYEYDGVGQRIATVLPMGQRSTTTYDAEGNVIATTDFDGATIHYTYDSQNRLTAEKLPDSSEIQYTYTPTGQRAKVTDAQGITTYAYDVRGRLLERTDPDGQVVQYTYDAAGNKTSVTTSAGKTSYAYDALDRLQTVLDPSGGTTQYAYDAVGDLVRTERPDGTVETRTYDSLDRLITIDDSGPSGLIESFHYTLGPTGQRIATVNGDGSRVDDTFDAVGRLIEEKLTDASGAVHSNTYTYDAAGNRLTRDDSAEGVTTYTYDANNRLVTESLGGTTTQYTYDANGNQLSRVEGNGVSRTDYHWSAQGTLSSVDSTDATGTHHTAYSYNADGLLVSATVDGQETRYLNSDDAIAQVLEEYAPGGAVLASYVHGLDLIFQNRGGQRSYYHTDALGSVRALTNASGTVTDTYTYDAFGRLLAQTGTTPNRYLFAGQAEDAASGTYYSLARYYDQQTGRFSSTDPLAGNLYDPASLNRYVYTENDPVDRTDPSGEQELSEVLTALTIISVLTNLGFAGYHLYKAATAATPQEAAREELFALFDTAAAALALFGGGFVPPGTGAALAGAGGVGSLGAAVIVRADWIIGSLAIPAAETIIMAMSSTGGGSSSGGSSSGGSSGGGGNVDVKDPHVDVPKHNLDRLAPTWAEQRQLLVDAVRRLSSVAPKSVNPQGSIYEATVQITSQSGSIENVTIRWFEFANGDKVINTAFIP
jgi:RHS repeat-associated protein